MKKTLLRFLAFMLVLITAFSFIACDGDPTPGPDPDPDPDPTPDPVPTDTLPENVSGTLDIYISLNEDEAAAYQMVADEYTYLQKEKGNTVKVNINNNSTADSYQKEVEALISMGVSNATIAKTGVAPSYYGTDSIVDLSSYLSLKNPYADNQVWKDVLEPEAYAPKFARGKSTVPSKQILMFFVRDHRPLIQHTADLTIQFAFCVTICNAQAKVKLTRFVGLAASHNQQIACPWNFSHQW